MIYYNIRSKIKVFYFAHRGAPQLIHENTIESIEKSIQLGCHGVELDLQKTKDDQIILFHDHFMKSKTLKHPITQTNYSTIIKFCKENNTPPPPKLKNLLVIINKYPNIVFNIEIKSLLLNNLKILQLITSQIPRHVLERQCIISSFNHPLLFQLKHCLNQPINIALILESKKIQGGIKMIINKIIIKLLNPRFLHLSLEHLNQSTVKWAHQNSIMVNAYTINKQEQLQKCINMGLDGIFTDNHHLYQTNKSKR